MDFINFKIGTSYGEGFFNLLWFFSFIFGHSFCFCCLGDKGILNLFSLHCFKCWQRLFSFPGMFIGGIFIFCTQAAADTHLFQISRQRKIVHLQKPENLPLLSGHLHFRNKSSYFLVSCGNHTKTEPQINLASKITGSVYNVLVCFSLFFLLNYLL